MLQLLIATTMAVLTGFYALAAERRADALHAQQARVLAESMSVYRQAVVAYYRTHDVTGASVDLDTLNAAGVLPAWSSLSSAGAASPWAHYRDADGVIYVYPAAAPSSAITTELVKLSRRSLNLGLFHAADASLTSPVDGLRTTPAALAALPIPDGAPVWMAGRE